MKSHTRKIFVLIVLLLLQKALHSQDLLPFESTITYSMLMLDAKLYSENDKEVQLCKTLMEKAAQRIINRYSKDTLSKVGETDAGNILAMIDSTFTEFDFLFYTDPKDIHYRFLTLALREQFDPILFKNNYQREYWENANDRKCKLIDCDQYCRIYMGISQMLSLPLSQVRIPKHHYLRWYFPDGAYFSWNPNDGRVYKDESKMECYNYAESYNEEHKNNYYPEKLTTDEVMGNYQVLWADNIWSERPIINVSEARENYIQALKNGYSKSFVFNNYVWLQIMNAELDKFLDFNELHAYIDQAIVLEKDVNYYDAKACLYALQKDFQKAVSTSKEGLKCTFDENEKRTKAEKHLQCFLKKENCRTLK